MSFMSTQMPELKSSVGDLLRQVTRQRQFTTKHAAQESVLPHVVVSATTLDAATDFSGVWAFDTRHSHDANTYSCGQLQAQ